MKRWPQQPWLESLPSTQPSCHVHVEGRCVAFGSTLRQAAGSPCPKSNYCAKASQRTPPHDATVRVSTEGGEGQLAAMATRNLFVDLSGHKMTGHPRLPPSFPRFSLSGQASAPNPQSAAVRGSMQEDC